MEYHILKKLTIISFLLLAAMIITDIGISLHIAKSLTAYPTTIINNHPTIPLPESVPCTITAYTKQNDPNITALLKPPVAGGTCAVSRDLIHWLGGQVYIEGVGVWKVNDVMNPKFSQSIDIYLGAEDKAITFGKQQHAVVFLGR